MWRQDRDLPCTVCWLYMTGSKRHPSRLKHNATVGIIWRLGHLSFHLWEWNRDAWLAWSPAGWFKQSSLLTKPVTHSPTMRQIASWEHKLKWQFFFLWKDHKCQRRQKGIHSISKCIYSSCKFVIIINKASYLFSIFPLNRYNVLNGY